MTRPLVAVVALAIAGCATSQHRLEDCINSAYQEQATQQRRMDLSWLGAKEYANRQALNDQLLQMELAACKYEHE